MFRYGDKITLTGINAINKKGEIIDYVLSFPLEDSDFYIPEDIAEISVFEYHEGTANYGYVAFKICVGKKTSIRNICELKENNVKFEKRIFKNVIDIDDPLCYYDEEGKHIVFARINPGDIMVSDIDDLRSALISVSNTFRNIKNNIAGISEYHPYDDTLSEEDRRLNNQRMQMCIKQRKRIKE